MVKLRYLWKWPAAIPANQNLNYLAWCRAARVNSGLPPGGIHSSFFVPNGTSANAYFALLLERVATAAVNANNVIVAHNGVMITPVPGGFPGGAPALVAAPGGGAHVVQIFVNIVGAAHIGGAPIRGVKCNLAGGPLPAALSAPAPLAPVANVHLKVVTASSEALYVEVIASMPGAHPVAGAFAPLHNPGGGAPATAQNPQNVNVIEMRITQNGGGVPEFSMYPL